MRATARQHRHGGLPARPRGIMLVGLLIGLALSSIALLALVDNWTVLRQREREQELLFVGDQYRQAIRRYYYGAPSGQPRQLPMNLQALLGDERYPSPVRYLRRLYPDPITGSETWGELRINDRLAGVYSLSEARPFKQAGFALADAGFEAQERYQDWVFVFVVPRSVAMPAPTLPQPGNGNPNSRPLKH